MSLKAFLWSRDSARRKGACETSATAAFTELVFLSPLSLSSPYCSRIPIVFNSPVMTMRKHPWTHSVTLCKYSVPQHHPSGCLHMCAPASYPPVQSKDGVQVRSWSSPPCVQVYFPCARTCYSFPEVGPNGTPSGSLR